MCEFGYFILISFGFNIRLDKENVKFVVSVTAFFSFRIFTEIFLQIIYIQIYIVKFFIILSIFIERINHSHFELVS